MALIVFEQLVVLTNLDYGFLMIKDTVFVPSGAQLFVRREEVLYFHPAKVQQPIGRMIREHIALRWGTGPRAEKELRRSWFGEPFLVGLAKSVFKSVFSWDAIWLSLLLLLLLGSCISYNLSDLLWHSWYGWLVLILLFRGIFLGLILLFYLLAFSVYVCTWPILYPMGRVIDFLKCDVDRMTPRRALRVSRGLSRLYSTNDFVLHELYPMALSDWKSWCWCGKPTEPFRGYDWILARIGMKEYPLGKSREALEDYVNQALEESRLPEVFAAVADGPLLQALESVKPHEF